LARNSLSRLRLTAIALATAGALCLPAVAEPLPQAAGDPATFLHRLWPAAQARGISRAVFDRATAGLTPDLEVAVLAFHQPEQHQAAGAYITQRVSDARIATGRQLLGEHAALLTAIERAYGVDRHVLLAIWGIESAYGTAMGSHQVVRALASLAIFDERRAAYWQSELLATLRMLQEGAAAPTTLVGSWAGAIGHTQFMPSTFSAYAVDFDRDGRRDICNSVADALASTANYLRASGWSPGSRWGFEVVLPADFDFGWSAPGRSRTLGEWRADGVRVVSADAKGAGEMPLRLILPAGARGPAFLVSKNFRALLRYNPSATYALAVGHLADRIAGGRPLVNAWPADDKPLARAEREELQRLLAFRGFDTGGLDGLIGDQTRAAIRATQRRLNLVEDGYPSFELLQRLRNTSTR
jgi:membrane-bound lytic murein transglycosylase B